MKKILFVFLLLSVLRGNIVCGQSVIDSLRIEMSKLGDADTHNEKKAEICLRLSEEYESFNTDLLFCVLHLISGTTSSLIL